MEKPAFYQRKNFIKNRSMNPEKAEEAKTKVRQNNQSRHLTQIVLPITKPHNQTSRSSQNHKIDYLFKYQSKVPFKIEIPQSYSNLRKLETPIKALVTTKANSGLQKSNLTIQANSNNSKENDFSQTSTYFNSQQKFNQSERKIASEQTLNDFESPKIPEISNLLARRGICDTIQSIYFKLTIENSNLKLPKKYSEQIIEERKTEIKNSQQQNGKFRNQFKGQSYSHIHNQHSVIDCNKMQKNYNDFLVH